MKRDFGIGFTIGNSVGGKLAEFLGLSKKYCLGANLRVGEFSFFKELLRDDGLSIGRYDGRLIAKEELKIGEQQANDPSDDAVTAPFYTTLNDYLGRELGVKTTLKYNIFGSFFNC